MPVEELTEALWSAYQAEVMLRDAKPINDEETFSHLRQAAEWLANGNGKFGLMLQGLYGNGKTTLMLAICHLVNYLYASPNRDERYEFMIADARKISRLGSQKDSETIYRTMCQTPLLAIDDLGEEPAEILNYGMVLTPVKDLLLERYRARRLTIVTTNLVNSEKNPQLRERYGQRMVDRFREMMQIIVFRNASYRGLTGRRPS
ncbi:MAG: hypothetical protein HDS14_08390 [Bacteroides sp.]|nr:hypothetical protein [Bacteroides sp.]